MYAVLVDFNVKPGLEKPFKDHMLEQAQSSLALEENCLFFDVCQDPEDPQSFFLYELYSNAEAFKSHLKSEHFKSFDAVVAPWLNHKAVRCMDRIALGKAKKPKLKATT